MRAVQNVAIALLCLTLFLPTAPAVAYVLRGGHILQLMAVSQGKAKHLKIDQHLVVYDPSAVAGRTTLPETVRYSFPYRFRSDIDAESIHRIHVARGRNALTVIDRKITSESGGLFDRYKDPLLLRSRSLLERWLADMGIDAGTTSIGRFNDTLALVIGAQYPDESVSQLWVDKATFRPLRLLVKTGEPLVREFEIRYLQWQAVGDGWYPWHVEFYENQMLVRLIQVGTVALEDTMAREMFDIAALKRKFAVKESPAAAGAEGDQPSEVQDTINQFKKRFKK